MARLQIAGSGGESINYLRDVYHLMLLLSPEEGECLDL